MELTSRTSVQGLAAYTWDMTTPKSREGEILDEFFYDEEGNIVTDVKDAAGAKIVQVGPGGTEEYVTLVRRKPGSGERPVE